MLHTSHSFRKYQHKKGIPETWITRKQDYGVLHLLSYLQRRVAGMVYGRCAFGCHMEKFCKIPLYMVNVWYRDLSYNVYTLDFTQSID